MATSGSPDLLLLILLAAGALACNPRAPTTPAPVWGWGGPTEYILAFHFFEYPPLLCGTELPKGHDVDANRLKVHLAKLPLGELFCKYRAPYTYGIVQSIIDLALEYRLPITMDVSTYFNIEMRRFECIGATNISYYVFDFYVTYAHDTRRKQHCNFKRGVFGGDWKESSYPISTLNFEFPGLPLTVCRPLRDPSMDMPGVDFIRPFFIMWTISDLPFACIFKRTNDFEFNTTEELIRLLAQKVDISYYFDGQYVMDVDRLVVRVPEVMVPYVACDGACQPGWYRWQVEGPSGRSSTCCFLPNTGPPARHCYRPYWKDCVIGYDHRSDGRCCYTPRRKSRDKPFTDNDTATDADVEPTLETQG